MRDNYLFIFLFVLLIFSFANLQAQERIGLSLDRNNVLVGDPVKLKIDVQLPTGGNIRNLQLSFDKATLIPTPANPVPGQMTPVPPDGSDPDFDLKSLGKFQALPDSGFLLPAALLSWDTIRSANSTIFTNTLEIIPWDPGILKFPSMVLEYSLGNARNQIISNIIELKVNAPDAPAQNTAVDSLGLAPIKEIQREAFQWQDSLPYFLGLFILVLLGALLWVLLRKKKPVVPPPPATRWIPVFDLADRQLSALKEKKMWQQGAVKNYQSELTRIVRQYLENRYHIKALESPTSEILRQLQPLNFSKEHKNQLQEMLQMADMVKFAKANPDVSVHEQLMDHAFAFINTTKPTELLDETADGWIEIPVDGDPNSIAYQLARDKKVRKRITESPNDFLKFEEAPLGRRVAAALIDLVVFGLIMLVILFALNIIPTGGVFSAFYLFVAFVLLLLVAAWFYFIEIERRSGATPGKRIFSLQTLNHTQDHVSRTEALIRLIFKILETTLIPLFILYTLIKKSRVLLHDDITDTRVYYVKK